MTIALHGTFSKDDLAATFHGLGRDIFFIQVGAMDGLNYDPICSFVKELGWRGLLLEPMPDMFAKLQANYSRCEGLIFVEAAITDFDGQIEMIRVNPEAIAKKLLPETALGISTLMPDRGILGSRNRTKELEQLLESHKQKLTVPCYQLKTLLNQYKIQKVDLLVIDTEGADWMVARQLPLDQYCPRIVYLEYNHLSAYEQVACAEHFRNHGYRIYLESPSEENFMAIRSPA